MKSCSREMLGQGLLPIVTISCSLFHRLVIRLIPPAHHLIFYFTLIRVINDIEKSFSVKLLLFRLVTQVVPFSPISFLFREDLFSLAHPPLTHN